MSPPIYFFVPGTPQSRGSKRAFPLKNKAGQYTGRVAMADGNPKSKSWMAQVSAVAHSHYAGPLIDGPVELAMEFALMRPQGHFRKNWLLRMAARLLPSGKPDLDKLGRGTQDALSGIVYRDDSLVCEKHAKKRYARHDEQTGVHITVRRLLEGEGTYGENQAAWDSVHSIN